MSRAACWVGRYVSGAVAMLALATGCGDSPRKSVSKRGAISEETTVDTLAGSDDVVAALVSPLPGTKEAPHWYRDALRRLVDPRGRLSFFSLRVYRIGGSADFALADLALVLSRGEQRLEAEEIPRPSAAGKPEATVLGTRSLAAIRTGTLEPAEGFEVWFAVEGTHELPDFTAAELRFAGRALPLARRSIATDRFTAFASQARRDWIVGSLGPDAADPNESPNSGR